MKGLIHRCLQEFSTATLGDEAWEKIKESAGCEDPLFANTRDYPDEMTAALFREASNCSGLPEELVMEKCAQHAILHTLPAVYPIHFRLGGENPRIFLINMQRVIEDAARDIRGATLPEYDCEELPDGRLLIRCVSHLGFCSLLRGLILGVGLHFGQELKLRHSIARDDGSDHCEFEVDFS